jgi:hypothetical protein
MELLGGSDSRSYPRKLEGPSDGAWVYIKERSVGGVTLLLSEREACLLNSVETAVGARLLLLDCDLERVAEAVKWVCARCTSRFPPCHLRLCTYTLSSNLSICVPAQ